MTTSVQLTDPLLLLLDGLGDEKLQKEVDAAKERLRLANDLTDLSGEQLKFISDVVRMAEVAGKVGFQWKQLTRCPVCKASPGYVKFKSGPRKGRDNYDKPLSLPGVDLKEQFINIQGHANLGCCMECWKVLKPLVAEKLQGIQAEIPEHVTGHPPEFKHHPNRHCKKCGWIGSERLMGKKRAMMGDGWYPASCPQCGAENNFLGTIVIENAEGFEVFRLPTPPTP